MWEQVDSNKATEKQIKYAETLLEAYYGDINLPIYTMTKQEISVIIDDVKKKCSEKKIHLNGNTEEVQHGEMVEGRLMPYVETAVRSGRQLGRSTGSAIDAMQRVTSEAIRRTLYEQYDEPTFIRQVQEYADNLVESLRRTEPVTPYEIITTTV